MALPAEKSFGQHHKAFLSESFAPDSVRSIELAPTFRTENAWLLKNLKGDRELFFEVDFNNTVERRMYGNGNSVTLWKDEDGEVADYAIIVRPRVSDLEDDVIAQLNELLSPKELEIFYKRYPTVHITRRHGLEMKIADQTVFSITDKPRMTVHNFSGDLTKPKQSRLEPDEEPGIFETPIIYLPPTELFPLPCTIYAGIEFDYKDFPSMDEDIMDSLKKVTTEGEELTGIVDPYV